MFAQHQIEKLTDYISDINIYDKSNDQKDKIQSNIASGPYLFFFFY